MFLRLAPNHISSNLLLFFSRPEHSLKFDKSLNKFIADFGPKQRQLYHQHTEII